MAKLALNNTFSTGAKTTDATPTIIATFDTSFMVNVAFTVQTNVIAFAVDANDEVGNYVNITTFKRQAGSLAIVGASTAVHVAETIVGWGVAITASGNNIVITATGAAATEIQWNTNSVVLCCCAQPVRGDN